MEKRIRIGFFDSGVGGVSVMAYARKQLPAADTFYYADTAHVPYGTKTRDEVIRYTDEAVSCLVGKGVDAIVIACNTATSMAVETMRAKYSLPIIGMEPAVKPAALRHPHERVLVCATPLAIRGERLHHLIECNYTAGEEPVLAPLPGLVSFAEAGIFDRETVSAYLREAIDTSIPYAAVVLGCTHFGYFHDSFREVLGDVDLIDGTAGTVNRLISVLREADKLPETSAAVGMTCYIRSGVPVTNENEIRAFERLAARALSLNI